VDGLFYPLDFFTSLNYAGSPRFLRASTLGIHLAEVTREARPSRGNASRAIASPREAACRFVPTHTKEFTMRRITVKMACTFATLIWGVSAIASAQVPQSPDMPVTRDVYFTFSQQVMIPNETLPAGKYLFRVNSQDRNIVEIYTGDKSRMIRRVFAIHAARSDSPQRAEIRLIEGASDAPVAIGTWWYPLQRQGWEFIYPREQAMKLAKTARQPILTTAEAVPAEKIDASSDLVRLDPSGSQADFDASPNPPPTQVRGTAQTGQVADADGNANQVAAAMSGQSRPAPASTTARAETQSVAGRTSLPRTAGWTPTMALVSALACAAGLALGFRRRQA
jgi:hypothetical protein